MDSIVGLAVDAFVVAAICAMGVMPTIAMLLLLSKSLLAFRLSRKGVLTEGTCVGHKKYGGKSVGVLVEYDHPSGGRTKFEIQPYVGVLPNAGSKVKVYFLPRNPRAAMMSPLPTFVRFRFIAFAILSVAGAMFSVAFFVAVFGHRW